MKSIRTALLALTAMALSVGSATAFGHDHGGREGGGRGGGFASAPRGLSHGGGYLGGYAEPRGDFRPRDYGPPAFAPRGYAPSPYAPAPYPRPSRPMGEAGAFGYSARPQSFRRGQYIPHAYWSGEIANPRGQHLRTPPPGYGWVGVGPNAYLMQRSTGLVLDSVPGAW